MVIEITDEEMTEITDLREKISDNQRSHEVVATQGASGHTREKKLLNELLATSSKMSKIKLELVQLRSEMSESEFMFEFDLDEFRKMPPVKSLQLISEIFANRMNEEILKHKEYFQPFETIRGTRDVGARSCAFYNRGSHCQVDCPSNWRSIGGAYGIWIDKPDLRLHCCTLCLEVLGIVAGHSVIQCPWLRKSTWAKIKS